MISFVKTNEILVVEKKDLWEWQLENPSDSSEYALYHFQDGTKIFLSRLNFMFGECDCCSDRTLAEKVITKIEFFKESE